MFFRFIINHPGCWSSILSEYPYVYGELIAQKIKNNSYIDAYVLFKNLNKKNNNMGNLFIDIKKHKSIYDIEKIQTIKDKNIYITKIKAELNNSISQVVDIYDSPFYRELFYNGYEIWYVFSWYENFIKIIKDINKRGTLINFEKLDYDEFENNIIDMDISSNIKLLSEVYKLGYYSKPKKSNLKFLADNYNTTKSNLSKKLRLLEINAVSYYLRSHIITDDIDKVIHSYKSKLNNTDKQ
ncbi:helix-turn-helix domain-containing protein [Acidiplasma aeolicum]|jgi:predicted DNA binding protein